MTINFSNYSCKYSTALLIFRMFVEYHYYYIYLNTISDTVNHYTRNYCFIPLYKINILLLLLSCEGARLSRKSDDVV